MVNKYCNLDGLNLIKDEYPKINIGFDTVEEDVIKVNQDLTNLDDRVDTIITTPVEGVSAEEIIDARVGEVCLGDKIRSVDSQLADFALFETEFDDSKILVENYGAVGDGVTDDTAAFNTATAYARITNKNFVYVKDKTYLIEGNLTASSEVVVYIGRGKIVSPNFNNRYVKVYDPRTASGIVGAINPSYRYDNILNFASKLVIARGGGAKVKVCFVGDSLVQGTHRTTDNFWWVKHLENKLIAQFGDYFTFYNRGKAGSIISGLSNVLSTPVNAPYETDWVTSSGVKTWLQYIDDVSPDLIFCAFGINELDSNVYTDIVAGRTALKGISSVPDIVWVSSQIRTIDPVITYEGSTFGTYPDNEYSNNAGMTTRLVAQNLGDPIIDVNRNASIAMLGLDPYQYRLERWFGQYRTTVNAFSGNTEIISGGVSDPVTFSMASDKTITSKRLFRNCAIEFTPSVSGVFGTIKVGCRKDTKSTSEMVFALTNTGIIYYGISPSTGSFGSLASWVGNCSGLTTRIEVIESRVRVYVNSVQVLEYKTAYSNQFMAPITFLGQNTNLVISDVYINGDEYKQYLPRITAKEAFLVYYADGGNSLNHPNTRGELEMYEQPIDEFLSSLNNIEYISTLAVAP